MKNRSATFATTILDSLDSSLHSKRKQFLILTVTFVLTRLFYFFAVGIRFDAGNVLGRNYQMQSLDYSLLKTNFFQSIYYLHSQPPLFNIIIGAALNLFPANPIFAINLLFVFIGWAFALSLYYLMNWLGVGKKLSFFVMLWFILSPSSVLYENFLYTPYLEAGFLCISAMFLYRFLKNPTVTNGFGFFGILAALVLTRSTFHLFWFVLWLLVAFFFYRRHWRKVMMAAFFPFLIISLLYVKNYYTFGIFTSSSWLGMNLSRVTTLTLGNSERQYLADKLPPIAWVEPFSNVDLYQKFLPPPAKTNVPVLDEKNKPANKAYPLDPTNNFNNILYIEASKQQLNTALQIVRLQPRAYIEGVLTSFLIYCWPSNDYPFIKEGDTSNALFYIEKFYNTIFYGQYFTTLSFANYSPIFEITHLEDYSLGNYFDLFVTQIGFVILVVIPLLFFFGFRLIKRAFVAQPRNLPYLLTLSFIWTTIIYVTVTSNFLELGENQRFRFSVDSFWVILLALFIQSLIDKRNKNKQEKVDKETVIAEAVH